MFGFAELFEMFGSVAELAFSDGFREHLLERATFDKHRVTLAEILQVHQGKPRYFLNEGSTPSASSRSSTEQGRPTEKAQPAESCRAPIVMVGPMDAGRMLTVPLVPAGPYGVWRPVTAFQSNTHHKTRYLEGPSDE